MGLNDQTFLTSQNLRICKEAISKTGYLTKEDDENLKKFYNKYFAEIKPSKKSTEPPKQPQHLLTNQVIQNKFDATTPNKTVYFPTNNNLNLKRTLNKQNN